jgi:hypothetical protein
MYIIIVVVTIVVTAIASCSLSIPFSLFPVSPHSILQLVSSKTTTVSVILNCVDLVGGLVHLF